MVKTKKLNKHLGGFGNAVSSAANTTVNKAKSNPIATIVILLLVVLFIVLIVWLVNTLRGTHTKSTDKNPIWISNPVSANVIKHHKKFKKGFKVPESPNEPLSISAHSDTTRSKDSLFCPSPTGPLSTSHHFDTPPSNHHPSHHS